MTGFLKLALVGILLFGMTAANDYKCRDRRPSFPCNVKLLNFGMKIETLDLDDKNNIKDFIKNCDYLQDCFNTLPCRPGSTNKLDKTLHVVKGVCEAVVFVTEDFSNCDDKFPERDSECLANWNPFPNGIILQDDKMKVEKMKEYACQTYFGKDDCVKKEIIERCGQEEWNTFRKHMIKLSEVVVGKCDFSRLE